MTATSITLERRMGKKRTPIRRKPRTPTEQVAAQLRRLAGDRPASELAPLWGMSVSMVLTVLRGESMPPIDKWPRIAESLGLTDWREIIPPL